MIEELICLLEVNVFELLEEVGGKVGIRDGMVVLD